MIKIALIISNPNSFVINGRQHTIHKQPLMKSWLAINHQECYNHCKDLVIKPLTRRKTICVSLQEQKEVFWNFYLLFYINYSILLESVWIELILLKLKTENLKHCSKIIFKCVNSTVGPIFNEKVDKKCNLWVPYTVHGTHRTNKNTEKSTIAGYCSHEQ